MSIVGNLDWLIGILGIVVGTIATIWQRSGKIRERQRADEAEVRAAVAESRIIAARVQATRQHAARQTGEDLKREEHDKAAGGGKRDAFSKQLPERKTRSDHG